MARPPALARRRVSVLAAAVASVLALTGPATAAAKPPKGHDVSSHQRNVKWPDARKKGARFVYVKATESTGYRNPYFAGQYSGARKAGLIRGAYHFARPDRSSGAEQAAYFVRHGGGWRGTAGRCRPRSTSSTTPTARASATG